MATGNVAAERDGPTSEAKAAPAPSEDNLLSLHGQARLAKNGISPQANVMGGNGRIDMRRYRGNWAEREKGGR